MAITNDWWANSPEKAVPIPLKNADIIIEYVGGFKQRCHETTLWTAKGRTPRFTPLAQNWGDAPYSQKSLFGTVSPRRPEWFFLLHATTSRNSSMPLAKLAVPIDSKATERICEEKN